MSVLLSFWLPIVISALFVFVVSWLIHMLVPYHKGDLKKLPSEDEIMNALRGFNIPPGDYMMPRCDGKEEMKSEAYKEKLAKGPVAMMTVMEKGPIKMGQSLVLWFVYCIIVSIFAAYVTSRAVTPDSHYLAVFRFAGATAFVGYSLALLQNSIWYKRNWCTTLKFMFDGLIYGLVTAGVFGWLWPRM